jgi:site-specific DNA recombinase
MAESIRAIDTQRSGSVASRAHIYCRVSTAAQEDGYSLETQERACRAYAAEHGFAAADPIREIWSGADRRRPQLEALLERLLPGDIVLAYALDRLSRSQVDTAILIDRIEAAGATLALVTEDFEKSATGTFLRNAKAFVAELEREKIAERTQRGRRARVASGKPLAGQKAPYGYVWATADKSRLALDPEFAPVVRLIFDWALGGLTLRAISERLAKEGIVSPSGGRRWQPVSVREILSRMTYAGQFPVYVMKHVRRANGKYDRRKSSEDERIYLPDVAPAIVTPADFSAVAAQLLDNKKHSTRRNKDPEASLLRAGFIRCGHCGWTLGVTNPSPSSRMVSPQYRCTAKSAVGVDDCPRPSISASLVDGPVWARVAEVLRNPEIIAAEVARHRTDGGLERDLASINRHIESIATKQLRTAKAIAAVDDDDAAAPLLAEL